MNFTTYLWSLSLALAVISRLSLAQHNTPPVLVVVPRRWNIAVDTPVGTVVARVKVTDHDGDEVMFNIEQSGAALQGLSFHDGSPYFLIQKRNNEGIVRLAKPLTESFEPGDQLTLSITGMDNVSKITSRSEVFIIVDEKSHDDPSGFNQFDGFFSPPVLNQRPLIPTAQAESSTTSKTTTKDFMTPEEISTAQYASTKIYVIILVPTFIVVPALSVILYVKRHKINKARKKCCACILPSNADKDGAKVEDANGEFSHEMQIKSSGENEYTVAGSDWVRAGPLFSILFYLFLFQNNDNKKWEIPRNQVRPFSILGEGCFGQVYKGEVENIAGMDEPAIVAIKTLKTNATEKDKRDLLNELAVMKMMDPHPNVVRLLGCCTDKDPIFVIIEFVNGGTLQEFLRKSRSEHHYKNLHGASQTLSSRDLTSFAYQIAKGMEYLASKKLIHRDLAARNVLIDSSDQVSTTLNYLPFYASTKDLHFRLARWQILDLLVMSWPTTFMKGNQKENSP